MEGKGRAKGGGKVWEKEGQEAKAQEEVVAQEKAAVQVEMDSG